MRAKFVFEEIQSILKPKENEEIQRELDKMIKLVPNNVKHPVNLNSHYDAIIYFAEKGYDIRIKFENKTAEFIYINLIEKMVPFFQNGILNGINGEFISIDIEKSVKTMKKKSTYIKDFPPTSVGRHDIDSSVTWNMTDQEKQIAEQLYKGKNNDEYAFFISEDIQLAFIISKSGKYVTLVLEGLPQKYNNNNFINKNFSKLPGFSDVYLKGGWKKVSEIIEITKNLIKSI